MKILRNSIQLSFKPNQVEHITKEDTSRICKKHDLWIISDEVYDKITFDEKHVSFWAVTMTRS